MSSGLVAYIDGYILGNKPNVSGIGMYKHVSERVKIFTEMRKKAHLTPSNFKGVDKLIAERVCALIKPSDEVDYLAQPTAPAQDVVSPLTYIFPEEPELIPDGIIVWAADEPYLCPKPKDFPADNNSRNTATTLSPVQSNRFKKFCNKHVKFTKEDTVVLPTSLPRSLVLDSNKVAKIYLDEKELIVASKSDSEQFEKDSGAKPKTEPKFKLDLSQYVLGEKHAKWFIGKILYFKERYLLIGIFNTQTLGAFNRLNVTESYVHTTEDAKGYTIDGSLLIVDLKTKFVKHVKDEATYGVVDDTDADTDEKLSTFRGVTDFIINKEKVFYVKSTSSKNVTFKGFKLGYVTDTAINALGYSVTGKISHEFKSYTYEVFEAAIDCSKEKDSEKVKLINVAQFTPPDYSVDPKFGIDGSVIAYNHAKLAANENNPYTFYVQLGYELVFQLPYSTAVDATNIIWLESGFGKMLKNDSEKLHQYTTRTLPDYYYEDISLDVLVPMLGPKAGGVSKIKGHIYLEVQTKRPDTNDYLSSEYNWIYYDTLVLYETVDFNQPIFAPTSLKWEWWNKDNGLREPYYMYTGDYQKVKADPLDLFVAYHLWKQAIGGADSKTKNILAKLNIALHKEPHPVYQYVLNHEPIADQGVFLTAKNSTKIQLNSERTTDRRWIPTIDKLAGHYAFPYRKWFTTGGGNPGSFTQAVIGYNACQETFLVTHVGKKYAHEGVHTDKTARPVLIICGIGPYAEKWGCQGWEGLQTASPLMIEIFANDIQNGTWPEELSEVNDVSMPKVHMTGTVSVLGYLGTYQPSWDENAGNNVGEEPLHGMIPIKIAGYTVDTQHHLNYERTKTNLDIRSLKDNPNVFVMGMFCYVEKQVVNGGYKLKNYYLELRGYEIRAEEPVDPLTGVKLPFKLVLGVSDATSYWWSKSTPAKGTDPVPFWGPCQIDMFAKL